MNLIDLDRGGLHSRLKMSTNKNLLIESMIIYLEEIFSGMSGVKITPRLPSTTRRSPDLDQDYDPEANSLHLTYGVNIKRDGHEYFFPIEWAIGNGRIELEKEALKLREKFER